MNLDDLKIDRDYWYLCTPYSAYPGGYEAAYIEASRICAKLLLRGIHVFCPIAHTHPVSHYGHIDPERYDVFLPLVGSFMTHSYGGIVAGMDGWDKSTGIKWEWQ